MLIGNKRTTAALAKKAADAASNVRFEKNGFDVGRLSKSAGSMLGPLLMLGIVRDEISATLYTLRLCGIIQRLWLIPFHYVTDSLGGRGC